MPAVSVMKTGLLCRKPWTLALSRAAGWAGGIGTAYAPGVCVKVTWVPPPEMPTEWAILMPALDNPEKHFSYFHVGAGDDTSCSSGERPACKGGLIRW